MHCYNFNLSYHIPFIDPVIIITEDDLHRVPLVNSAPLKPTKYDAAQFDDEVMEDEHAYIDIKPAPPAHQAINTLDVKEAVSYFLLYFFKTNTN